jgi:hypothetical protein
LTIIAIENRRHEAHRVQDGQSGPGVAVLQSQQANELWHQFGGSVSLFFYFFDPKHRLRKGWGSNYGIDNPKNSASPGRVNTNPTQERSPPNESQPIVLFKGKPTKEYGVENAIPDTSGEDDSARGKDKSVNEKIHEER